MRRRLRIDISGRVQGVGFRPTVFRHARDAGVGGWVLNSTHGVAIEAEAETSALDEFVRRLQQHPPPQAQVERFVSREIPPCGEYEFRIVRSDAAGEVIVHVPPDLATCDDCLREMSDPADRRAGYPFLNCTNCGPRFTLIAGLPYDRERTSMAGFIMCADCRAEYDNPLDRRFDAQPNACADCGPALQFIDALGTPVTGDPLDQAVRRLREGHIVALKGIGGFHLACMATSDAAVAELRRRKNRPHKALAVMFADRDQARRYCILNEREASEMLSPAHPIVILDIHPSPAHGPGLSSLLSPDTRDIGALLPYTPLHHLLLRRISPLVMTSGNLAEEPIARNRDELGPILGRVADYALDHNRPVLRRCDDSVLRLTQDQRLFFRRSRGFVPAPVRLPFSGPPVFACGPDQKNVFGAARDGYVFLSQHIGDLKDYSALRFYEDSVRDWLHLFKVKPEIVAHDLHPDYHSTRFARHCGLGRLLAVQHHHAHIAAVMAENGLAGPVIGLAYDGTGYGDDGTLWGGEVLVGGYAGFRRAAHFKTYPLPGGEAGITHPARMALACLHAEGLLDAARDLLPMSDLERETLLTMIVRGLNCPVTSSAGRLFDAVAALLGFHGEISYEGQAAIRLQMMAAQAEAEPYPFDVAPSVLDFGPCLRSIIDDLRADTPRPLIASRFHRTIAEASAQACLQVRTAEGINDVALSGGVFQNHLLVALLKRSLSAHGFRVYLHQVTPPNDACIALGQAAIATAMNGR